MRLAQVGIEIEDLFGAPQDIEWAYADGCLWVLQARPITNLPSAVLGEVRWEPPFPGSAWWRRQVVENMPEPLSPLFDELYLREGLELSIDGMMEFFRMTYLRVEDFVDRPLFTTVNGYRRFDALEIFDALEKRAGLYDEIAVLRGDRARADAIIALREHGHEVVDGERVGRDARGVELDP